MTRLRARCSVRDMEGLSASVVLIGILLGLLLVVAFDVFCLLRLGTADAGHLVPRFAWAVVIVGASPIGGLVYRWRSVCGSDRLSRWPCGQPRRREAAGGPARRWRSTTAHPASPLGHAVAVMAIAGAAYLAQAGQILAAVAITVILVIIAFLKNTPPG